MNVVRFIYKVQYLLVLDRHKSVLSDKGDRVEGACKVLLGSTSGM